MKPQHDVTTMGANALDEKQEQPNQAQSSGQGKANEQHPQEIPFHVDGELEKTTQAIWTPNEIIRKFGQKDPATNYLVQIQGPEKGTSYKDKGDIPITIRPGYHFQIVSLGATTVSDGRPLVGVAAFIYGLKEMGYDPQVPPSQPDHVYFDYEVPVGKFAGIKVKLGFSIPPSFPVSGVPSGPHVSPHVLPLNPQSGPHPSHGVHASPFSSLVGGDWQYWSRPFPDWAARKKTVAAYLSHIHRLWETQ
ncbi:MAG: hypothetical protein ACRERR_08345 [Moraxellaceae bacterium]